MHACFSLLALEIFIAFSASGAAAQQARVQKWREEAKAAGLSEPALQRLAEIGFVISNHSGSPEDVYRQDTVPVLITSDCVVAAYVALLTAEFRRLEFGNAELLRQTLASSWDSLGAIGTQCGERSPSVGSALNSARFILATARVLIGDSVSGLETAEKEEVEAERTRVFAERPTRGSSWLPGGRDAGQVMDYRRCAPRGFYCTEVLSGYFRVISWLGLLRLDLEDDVGLATMILLAKSVNMAHGARARLTALYGSVDVLIGPSCALDLADVCGVLDKRGPSVDGDDILRSLAHVRAELKQASSAKRDGMARPVIHVVAPKTTPAVALFDSLFGDGSEPTGLYLAACLGSKFALEELGSERRARILAPGAVNRETLLLGSSLHAEFLRCLRLLFQQENCLWPFMRTPAWSAKSCSTVLAGWAWQMHLASLWGRRSGTVGSPPTEKPVGFVEPNSAFFCAFQQLVKRARQVFREYAPIRRCLVDAEGAHAGWRATMRIIEERAERYALSRAWDWLEGMVERLCEIALIEVNGGELRLEDREFIARFGVVLDDVIEAGSAFSGEPLYCVVDVHHDVARGRVFHVGVGLGRVVYVIVPWKGEECLCRGMIWPYYEFEDDRIVRNGDWAKRLRSAKEGYVELPSWLRKHGVK